MIDELFPGLLDGLFVNLPSTLLIEPHLVIIDAYRLCRPRLRFWQRTSEQAILLKGYILPERLIGIAAHGAMR